MVILQASSIEVGAGESLVGCLTCPSLEISDLGNGKVGLNATLEVEHGGVDAAAGRVQTHRITGGSD